MARLFVWFLSVIVVVMQMTAAGGIGHSNVGSLVSTKAERLTERTGGLRHKQPQPSSSHDHLHDDTITSTTSTATTATTTATAAHMHPPIKSLAKPPSTKKRGPSVPAGVGNSGYFIISAWTDADCTGRKPFLLVSYIRSYIRCGSNSFPSVS